MTTTIVKWGNSRGIRLPKPFLENLNLKDNDVVDVFADSETIIIKKSLTDRHKTLTQRLEEFYGKDIESILKEADESIEQPIVVDWGKPVGEEVW
ncbi:MAG: AbrB/MazE/SpoVT family DNA-binding domain-containing protein [Clostridiales bacterium]|jgi:antitoxin MazE|nr:AbrB/MazE/SpoVT family DNA-binding domain-containing protein [Clostridiales bacterium]